jgi:hypothetical protein
MTRRKLFDNPRIQRLQTVMEAIESGELLFPEFQRLYLWENEQRLRLLDSILKGLPIGSILVWRTTEKLALQKQLGSVPLPPLPSDTGEQFNYVLDGLQRLTTLYVSLKGRADPHETEGVRWPIYFDLDKDLDRGDEQRFRLCPRHGKPDDNWLPMSALFSAKELWEHQTKLMTRNSVGLANKAENLANLFKDYELAVVPIISNDLDLATTSFERINTQGTPMGQPDMLRALTYRDGFDLRGEFAQLNEDLRWEKLSEDVYVNTLKALIGHVIYSGGVAKVVEAIKTDSGLIDKMRRGMQRAVGFLHDYCGICGEKALPYAYQLVALARASANGHGLDEVADRLVTWFWATTYSEYLSQAADKQLRETFEHVERICEGEAPLPRDLTRRIEALERFSGNAVRGLARAHLLARRELVDLSGAKVNGPGLLAHGTDTWATLVPRVTPRHPANRILVAPDEARQTRQALLKPDAPLLEDPRLRAGHVLPPVGHEAYRNPNDLLEWRRRKLDELEGQFVRSLGLEYEEDADAAKH